MAFDPFLERCATALFALAVFHTFFCRRLSGYAHALEKRQGASGLSALLHFFGEVEVVFGLWAMAFVAILAAHGGMQGEGGALAYLGALNFTEAIFVFVVLCMASTRPVLQVARQLIDACARILPVPRTFGFYVASLTLGPLLGSVITEPAAMTVTALLLKDRVFDACVPNRFRYLTLGLLFVNVSIGGTLTPYAAPPVLMVAAKWGWGIGEMLTLFGWKSAVCVFVGTLGMALAHGRLLWRAELPADPERVFVADARPRAPAWLVGSQLVLLGIVIAYHSHAAFFVPVFLLFIGWCEVTGKHQDPLRMRESLLVGFFLGGLVALGTPQSWWIRPLLESLGPLALFSGAAALTAVTDNAALTYLGSLVPDLPGALRYLLVAGAVAGGGLTVIANAPNPAGFGILSPSFKGGISPLGLFLGALPFSLLALAVYWAFRPA